MAQGIPPQESYVDMPQGWWVVPRWLGIEIVPAAVLVIVEMFAVVCRMALWITIMTIFVVSMYWLFLRAFARDEKMVSLMFKNRHYLNLISMRAHALASSRIENLEQVL
jgi:hypothetical protein